MSYKEEVTENFFENDDINVTEKCHIPLKYEIEKIAPLKPTALNVIAIDNKLITFNNSNNRDAPNDVYNYEYIVKVSNYTWGNFAFNYSIMLL